MAVTTITASKYDYTTAAYQAVAAGDELVVVPGVTLMGNVTGWLLNLTRSGTYTNHGAVMNTTAGSGGAIYLLASGAFGRQPVALNNSGVLQSSGGSTIQFEDGIASVINSGSIISYKSSAIFNNGDITSSLNIVNTGVIASYASDRVAILTSIYSAPVTLTNDGQVIGTLRLGGIADTVDNLANGTISGNVSLGDGINRLANAGIIAGAVSAGGGGDQLTNTGRISGDVSLGDGANGIVNDGELRGSLALGSGADTVINTGVVTAGVSLGDGANLFSNAGAVIGRIFTLGTARAQIAVTAGSGDDVFINTGLVTGDVDLGGGSNTLTSSGAIHGAVTTGAGSDVLNLAYGTVTGNIVAGLGGDTVTGTDHRDVIHGDDLGSTNTGGGADTIVAGGGDDLVFGGYGMDTVSGGWGDDVVYGGSGADQLLGNQNDDVLFGNQDNDWMHGGQGDDVLYGGQGTDTLNGGVGNDVLYGNLGDDTFVFSAQGFGHDTIADFGAAAGDRIQLGPGTFADFADVHAHAQDISGGVLLTDAVGDTLYIVGASTGGLSAGQFVFG